MDTQMDTYLYLDLRQPKGQAQLAHRAVHRGKDGREGSYIQRGGR